jgi:hypothetical protein
MNKAEKLYNKIKITKDMLDYNVANILCGDYKKTIDPYIKFNKENLAYNEKYKNTILGIYFRNKIIQKKLYSPGYSSPILKLSIEKYIKQNKQLSLPGDDEIVLYFRLGDHIANWNSKVTPDHFFYDYKSKINEKIKSGNYKKITIVTNLAFCGDIKHKDKIDNNIKNSDFYKLFQDGGCFTLNEKNLKLNKDVFLPILDDIIKTYDDYTVDIFSSNNPDHDICYLYKNGFIGDVKNSWYKIFNYNG